MPKEKSAATTSSPEPTPTRKKNGHARAVLPLIWSATEYVSQKRWWWYVAFGYIVVTVALLLLAVGNWSAALVTFAIGATIFALYLAKPRAWTYTLTGTDLRIVREPRRGRADEITLSLDQYRVFTTEAIPRSRREPYLLIVLLPRGRFKTSRDIYLTSDVTKDVAIAEALSGAVPFEDEPAYGVGVRFVDQIARWLRIG